jgi:hypothetical protein
MPDVDLTTLSDDDLDALRVAVLTEQERRARVESLPGTIANLRREYLAAGGDPAALTDPPGR